MPNNKMKVSIPSRDLRFYLGILEQMSDGSFEGFERWDRDMVKRRFRSLMTDWFWNNFNLKPFLRGYNSAEKPVMDLPFDWGHKMSKAEAVNYAAVKKMFDEWLDASCRVIDAMFDSIAVEKGAEEDW